MALSLRSVKHAAARQRATFQQVARWLARVHARCLVLGERIAGMRRPDVYLGRLIARVLPDHLYLAIGHRLYFGSWPDYRQPKTFNEHIHAYMLRCRAPMLKIAADKSASRRYIEQQIGSRYLVPCLGIWTRADDVPVESLPRPCVLKPTVASGVVVFLREGDHVSPERLRARLRLWLQRDYSRVHREWSYRGIERGVIAEPMLLDGDGEPPPDYKAYVIGGKVRFVQVDRGRFGSHTRNLYSPDWGLLPARLTIENHPPDERPERLAELIEIAERLAAPFEFLRVDCYLLNGALYVGELTNTPGAGFEKFIPASYATEFGSYWVVRESSSL